MSHSRRDSGVAGYAIIRGLVSLFSVCALVGVGAQHTAAARPRQSGNITQFTARITPTDPLNRFSENPRNYSLSESNSLWSITTSDKDGDGFIDYVQIQIQMLESQDGLGQGFIWFLTFTSTRLGRPLAPGHYADAVRAGLETDGYPGLEISRGSCTVSGEFTVLEAQYKGEVRFAATFRQQCDGFTGARTGSVYFKYSGTPAVGLTVLNESRLPDATIGAQYSAELNATGGSPPYAWSLSEGQLPPGLTFSATGRIAGIPTASGNQVFRAQVSDTSPAIGLPTQVANARLEINVSNTPAELSITTEALPNAARGLSYDYQLQAKGGLPPYIWTVAEGHLPSGLHITADGHVIGTPEETGTFDLAIQVVDSAAQTARRQYSIGIIDPPEISKVKYKAGKGKLTISGQRFAQMAELLIDNRKIEPKSQDETSFVVKNLDLTTGPHEVRVVNPDGGTATVSVTIK